jgi:hypothetical protein
LRNLAIGRLAERVRFELTSPVKGLPVFKTPSYCVTSLGFCRTSSETTGLEDGTGLELLDVCEIPIAFGGYRKLGDAKDAVTANSYLTNIKFGA